MKSSRLSRPCEDSAKRPQISGVFCSPIAAGISRAAKAYEAMVCFASKALKEEYAMKKEQFADYAAVRHMEYARAFRDGDLAGLIEASGELFLIYLLQGNTDLARRWGREYQQNVLSVSLN